MNLKQALNFSSSAVIASAVTLSSTAAAQQELPAGYIGEIDPLARIAVLGTTVVSNGILCSITAAAKKRKVLQEASQCMGAGLIQYMGMEVGMYDVPVLPGMALRIVETGTSIVENTVGGREPLELLHYSMYGPGLFEVNTNTGKVDFFWRIEPLAGINYNLFKQNELDMLNTLSYQTITFKAAAEADKNSDSARILGYTVGNVMTHDPSSGGTLAHEFSHVLQYVRFRPAQEYIPAEIGFFKDKAHLRIGEDTASLLFNIPIAVCTLTEETSCGRRWWNPTELESYTMETANTIGLKIKSKTPPLFRENVSLEEQLTGNDYLPNINYIKPFEIKIEPGVYKIDPDFKDNKYDKSNKDKNKPLKLIVGPF
ncbi:hypothetical protein HY494_01710 [Candidatus Woesearchaeota archaeon]|nr:hypothetical protein [Candidatus Woesearchaeota archaeon]